MRLHRGEVLQRDLVLLIELLKHLIDRHLRESIITMLDQELLLDVIYDVHFTSTGNGRTHVLLLTRARVNNLRRHLASGPPFLYLSLGAIAFIPLRSHLFACLSICCEFFSILRIVNPCFD